MSPTPKSAESSGNESAEQQLFAESQASASKPRQPPTSAAIRSALLLNAARVDKLRPVSQRPSSLPPDTVNMSKKNAGSGKLKRPSILRENMAQVARANLARRGDIYELDDESPEKSKGVPYKLSETVNHNKPIKRVKNVKKVDLPKKPRTTPGPVPPVQENDASDGDELFVPSQEVENNTSTREGSVGSSSPKKNQRKSGRLAGKTVAIEHIDFSKQPGVIAPKKARPKRKTPEEAAESDTGSKSPRRESPPVPSRRSVSVAVRPKPQTTNPGAASPEAKVAGVTSGDEEQAFLSLQGDPNEFSDISDEAPQLSRQRKRPATSRKNALSNSWSAKQSKGNTKNAQAQTISSRRDIAQEEVALPDLSGQADAEEALASAASGAEAELSELDWDADDVLTDEHHDTGSESELSDEEIIHAEPSRAGQVSAFRQVFEFTEGDRRRGRCKTDEARMVQNTCRAGTMQLEESDTTNEDVSRLIEQIRALLHTYGRGDSAAQRSKLKVDAYQYLFRNLVAFFVSLHGWFSQRHDEVTESLEAVRALYTLAEAIVLFSEAITSWKAPLPAQHKNVTSGRDVDVQLITPLRKVVESYRIALDDLEQAERVWRSREEAIEKDRRREARAKLKDERWKRWQDLHIWRQECEPDVSRRPRLFIDPSVFNTRYEHFDERDANGVKFERIPLFRDRESPPRRAVSDVQELWSDAQMEALIEGLTRFAGPEVFRKIFRKYCRPGAPLRNFTVPEITAQAASIRSTLLSQYQANNWEVPDWIKKIPILP